MTRFLHESVEFAKMGQNSKFLFSQFYVKLANGDNMSHSIEPRQWNITTWPVPGEAANLAVWCRRPLLSSLPRSPAGGDVLEPPDRHVVAALLHHLVSRLLRQAARLVHDASTQLVSHPEAARHPGGVDDVAVAAELARLTHVHRCERDGQHGGVPVTVTARGIIVCKMHWVKHT